MTGAALELDEIKRGLADLNDRIRALEAKAPHVAPDVADLNARVLALEAKVTRLQMFSLDRPEPGEKGQFGKWE